MIQQIGLQVTEALDLDEKTAARLFPIINRYDEKMAALKKQRRTLRRQLRRSLRSPGTPDAEIDAIVNRMVAHQKRSWKLQDERFRAVRKVLTPRQAARILVVLPQIDRQIRQQIRRAMKRGRSGKGKRGNTRLD